MNQHDSQLDRHIPPKSSRLDTGPSRRLSTGQMCMLVVVLIVLHWIGMQFIVNWFGGEDAVARAQTVSTASPACDDGWRRTARGWEYNMNDADKHPQVTTAPTQHISPYHFWPAAAAACMLLLITGLPDARTNQVGRPS